MMAQYRDLKRAAGDALLLFRMGDFYELFESDAQTAAPLLDLVLTTRDRDTRSSSSRSTWRDGAWASPAASPASARW